MWDYPLIYSTNSKRVAIFGVGVVNGGGNSPPGHLVKKYEESTNFLYPQDLPFPGCSPFSCRVKLVVFFNCSDVLLSGVSLINSPLWTLEFSLSKNIQVSNCYISTDRRWPNGDGIDIVSSSHVTISNTTISTGDDNIDVSTHVVGYPSEDIVVEGCTLSSTSCSQNIGMFSMENISRVVWKDNVVVGSNRGAGIMPRIGNGSIHDISYLNISISTRQYSEAWWGNGEPIYVCNLFFNFESFPSSFFLLDLCFSFQLDDKLWRKSFLYSLQKRHRYL